MKYLQKTFSVPTASSSRARKVPLPEEWLAWFDRKCATCGHSYERHRLLTDGTDRCYSWCSCRRFAEEVPDGV